jgi:hypothetical protein
MAQEQLATTRKDKYTVRASAARARVRWFTLNLPLPVVSCRLLEQTNVCGGQEVKTNAYQRLVQLKTPISYSKGTRRSK